MSGHHVDFVALDLALSTTAGWRSTIPSRSCWIIAWASSGSMSSSWAICSSERFRPMRYRQAIQARSGWWWPAKMVSVRSSKRLPAAVALVALAVGLGVVPAVLDDRVGGAMGAGHAVGPAHVPDRLDSTWRRR